MNACRVSREDDGSRKILSIYFSEINDGCRAREIFNLFKKYGDLVEVVIPTRKDKPGRMFGFARFVDMEDVRLLAVRLDNIFIGDIKIYADLPRFQREQNQFNIEDKKRSNGSKFRNTSKPFVHRPFKDIPFRGAYVGFRSYAEVVDINKHSHPRQASAHLVSQLKKRNVRDSRMILWVRS